MGSVIIPFNHSITFYAPPQHSDCFKEAPFSSPSFPSCPSTPKGILGILTRDQSTMGVKGAEVQLSSDIDFIKTPAAKKAEFETGEDCGIALTNVSPCH